MRGKTVAPTLHTLRRHRYTSIILKLILIITQIYVIPIIKEKLRAALGLPLPGRGTPGEEIRGGKKTGTNSKQWERRKDC